MEDQGHARTLGGEVYTGTMIENPPSMKKTKKTKKKNRKKEKKDVFPIQTATALGTGSVTSEKIDMKVEQVIRSNPQSDKVVLPTRETSIEQETNEFMHQREPVSHRNVKQPQPSGKQAGNEVNSRSKRKSKSGQVTPQATATNIEQETNEFMQQMEPVNHINGRQPKSSGNQTVNELNWTPHRKGKSSQAITQQAEPVSQRNWRQPNSHGKQAKNDLNQNSKPQRKDKEVKTEKKSKEEKIKETSPVYQRLVTWSKNNHPDYLVWSISKGLHHLVNLTSQDFMPQDWYNLLVIILARASQAKNQKEETRDVFEVLYGSHFLNKHLFEYLEEKKLEKQYWQDGQGFFNNVIDILLQVLEIVPTFSNDCVHVVSSLSQFAKAILSRDVQADILPRLAIVTHRYISTDFSKCEPGIAATELKHESNSSSRYKNSTEGYHKTRHEKISSIQGGWVSAGFCFRYSRGDQSNVARHSSFQQDLECDNESEDVLDDEEIQQITVAQQTDFSFRQKKNKKELWGDRKGPGERQFHSKKGKSRQKDWFD